VTIDGLVNAEGRPVTSVLFVPAPARANAKQSEGAQSESPETKGAAKAGKGKTPAAAATASTSATASATASGPALTPKESTTLETLRVLCAENSKSGGKGVVGVTASEWKRAAGQRDVPSATFDRAKTKLVDRKLVGCDRPGQPGARYFPV
jgi:hypothetical protein